MRRNPESTHTFFTNRCREITWHPKMGDTQSVVSLRNACGIQTKSGCVERCTSLQPHSARACQCSRGFGKRRGVICAPRGTLVVLAVGVRAAERSLLLSTHPEALHPPPFRRVDNRLLSVLRTDRIPAQNASSHTCSGNTCRTLSCCRRQPRLHTQGRQRGRTGARRAHRSRRVEDPAVRTAAQQPWIWRFWASGDRQAVPVSLCMTY